VIQRAGTNGLGNIISVYKTAALPLSYASAPG